MLGAQPCADGQPVEAGQAQVEDRDGRPQRDDELEPESLSPS
jgi:hypothetical protein